jgi:hypothetical protein
MVKNRRFRGDMYVELWALQTVQLAMGCSRARSSV